MVAADLEPDDLAADYLDGERLAVWRNRYREARAAGLDRLDSTVFADSTSDISVLRRLTDNGCAPDLIAKIVL